MFVKLNNFFIFAIKTIGMTESFLHYVWRMKLFDMTDLRTTDGEALTVIAPGIHNHDAGPDFKQAVLRIGEMKWAGDVEIHVRSSDWYRHRHELDEKYLSVALHVVFVHDCEVSRLPGERYPTLELRDRIPKALYAQYEYLMRSPDRLSCLNLLSDVSSVYVESAMSTALIERLLRKQQRLYEMVTSCRSDWNEALYRQLAIGFGFKTNAVAFEMLAQSLPYRIIAKHLDSSLQINALVFGQAGMLQEEAVDEYHDRLQYEYDYLRYKYQLAPIAMSHWNLLRLRPANFPCLRLAQFASLLCKIPLMMRELLTDYHVDSIFRKFAVSADEYWKTHYHFGKQNILPHQVQLGDSAIALLIVNTVIPFLFAYYRFSGEDYRLETVVSMLEQLPYENNKLTRQFADSPMPKRSAWDSQAQIELLQNYCNQKRCLECAIGGVLLKGQGTQ